MTLAAALAPLWHVVLVAGMEGALAALALVLVAAATGAPGATRAYALSERVSYALALKLFMGCALGEAVGFLGLHGPLTYAGLGAAATMGALWFGRRPTTRATLTVVARELAERPLRLRALLWLAPLAVVAATGAVRVSEIDSVFHLEHMADWLLSGASPYRFASEYVSFWELGYMPTLSLTRSDAFLWVTSLQAVALLCLCTYLVARRLEVSRSLAFALAVHSVALHHLWGGPSGAPTLKNDMIYNAGLLLAVLATLDLARRERRAVAVGVLGVAASFVGVKYSGPPVLVALALVAVASRPRAARQIVTGSLLALPVVALSVGHYYVKNALRFGNPVYPVKMAVLGKALPGSLDLRGTSFFSVIAEPEAWARLLGVADRMWWSGPLLPLALAAFVVAPLVAWKRWREGELFVWLAGAVMWLMYARAFWSASNEPGDLFYLRSGWSLRYVTAGVALGFCLLCAAVVRRWPTSARWLVVALGADSLVRLSYVCFGLPNFELHGVLDEAVAARHYALPLAGGFVAAVWLLTRVRPSLRVGIGAAFLFGALGLGRGLVELNADQWLLEQTAVTKVLHTAPAAKVFSVTSAAGLEQSWGHLRYPMWGGSFQHTLTRGSLEELGATLARDPTSVEAVVLKAAPPDGVLSSASLLRVLEQLGDPGLTVASRDEMSAVLVRAPLGEPFASHADTHVALLSNLEGSPRCLTWPGRPAEHEDPLVLTRTPAAVWRRRGECYERTSAELTPREVDWYADPRSSEVVARVPIAVAGERWRLDLPTLRDGAQITTAIQLGGGAQDSGGWQLAVEAPGGRSEVTAEGTLRVRAAGPGPWLALTHPVERKWRGVALAWLAKVRSPAGPGWNLHHFDFEHREGDAVRFGRLTSRPSAEWLALVGSHRFTPALERDYFAVGVEGVRGETDYELAELQVLSRALPPGLYAEDGTAIQ